MKEWLASGHSQAIRVSRLSIALARVWVQLVYCIMLGLELPRRWLNLQNDGETLQSTVL